MLSPSHISTCSAGSREECLSRGNRIITRAIQLASRHPEFRFLLEDEVFVANYVDTHRGLPELDELKRLVKAGRIEIAPKWAGILQNLPRGEAHVRNQVYGKRYAREVFQVDPQVAHLGDLPGYTSQFPQILAKSGTPFMVMTRMGPLDRSLFRWKSPDGSEALVWNAVKGYGWGVRLGLHRDSLDNSQLATVAKEVKEVQATTRGPVLLGWGTDLWSPNEKLVDNAALLNKQFAPSRFRLATTDDYFRAAAKAPGTPEIAGEIPSSWANIISSMSHLWPPAISAADTLLTAEKFAAINFALGYADYPQKEFEATWKTILEVMDHNNFGQGGETGDNRKIGYAQKAMQESGQILRDMLRNIAERVRSPIVRSTPVVVFNPMSWRRDDVVRTHVSLYGDVSPGDIADYRKGLRLVDESGASVPFHVEGYSGTVSRALEIVFIARAVPSLGYKTYFLVPAEKPDTFPNACDVKLDDGDPAKPKRTLGSDQLENEYYRLSVDRATGRITVFDKELGRVVLKDVETVATEDRGGDTLSNEQATGRIAIRTVNRVTVEENNPVRAVVKIDGEIAGVSVVQRLSLYGGLKKIDLENTVDWKQDRFMKIEQLFPYADPAAQVRYGIPFGSAAGSDILPNSGPHFRDEVPREVWKNLAPDSRLGIRRDRGGGRHHRRRPPIDNAGRGRDPWGMLRGSYSAVSIVLADKPFLHKLPPAGKYVFRYSLSSGKGTGRLQDPTAQGWRSAIRSFRSARLTSCRTSNYLRLTHSARWKPAIWW